MTSQLDDNSWVVLVGGEHYECAKNLGGHSSIISIGMAYAVLRRKIRRERIIVIAQVEECWKWHQQDAVAKIGQSITDSERIRQQTKTWEEKKFAYEKYLGPILGEGGADYDGTSVNPETVLQVLLGEKSEKYPRVIEYVPGKTKVFLSMFSHGNWNAKLDNHYFLMPHPNPTVYGLFSSLSRPELIHFDADGNPSTAPVTIEVTTGAEASETTPLAAINFLPNDESSRQDIQSSAPVQGPMSTQTKTGFSTYPSGLAMDIDDPIYRCINSSLSLKPKITTPDSLPSSDHFKPFRVLLHKRSDTETEVTDDELNRRDATLLHWQYMFEAFKTVIALKQPKAIFVFQQVKCDFLVFQCELRCSFVVT